MSKKIWKIQTVLKQELTAEEYHWLIERVKKSAIEMSQKKPSFSALELIEEYDLEPLDASAVFNILRPLVKSGQLLKTGGRKTTRYSLPN